jgi:hypothetical protein
VDLIASGSLASSGLDGYARVDEIVRLSYAKTDEPPREIYRVKRVKEV